MNNSWTFLVLHRIKWKPVVSQQWKPVVSNRKDKPPTVNTSNSGICGKTSKEKAIIATLNNLYAKVKLKVERLFPKPFALSSLRCNPHGGRTFNLQR